MVTHAKTSDVSGNVYRHIERQPQPFGREGNSMTTGIVTSEGCDENEFDAEDRRKRDEGEIAEERPPGENTQQKRFCSDGQRENKK